MSDGALPLHGWTVVSLRPRGQHASVRCAAAPLGARTLGLSPFAIAPRDDPAGRAQNRMFERSAARFLENLRRYQLGEPLEPRVDYTLGY